jgi:hypothetical protein
MSDPLRPELSTLAAWITGQLGAPRTAEVSAALDGDATLRDDVAWLRRVLVVARDLPMVPPPPLLRQGLRQRFRRRYQDPAGDGGTMITMVAVPVYDGREAPAMAGLRAQQPDTRAFQLAWRAELADLLVEVDRRGPHYRLDGQVLLGHSTSSPVFEVTVRGEGFEARSVDGDTDGRFSIAGIPEAAVQLALTNGELEILADLDLADGGHG